jgi:hypothetical protein
MTKWKRLLLLKLKEECNLNEEANVLPKPEKENRRNHQEVICKVFFILLLDSPSLVDLVSQSAVADKIFEKLAESSPHKDSDPLLGVKVNYVIFYSFIH